MQFLLPIQIPPFFGKRWFILTFMSKNQSKTSIWITSLWRYKSLKSIWLSEMNCRNVRHVMQREARSGMSTLLKMACKISCGRAVMVAMPIVAMYKVRCVLRYMEREVVDSSLHKIADYSKSGNSANPVTRRVGDRRQHRNGVSLL
jgi:hypothetical protein